jgi:hypothetical protein
MPLGDVATVMTDGEAPAEERDGDEDDERRESGDEGDDDADHLRGIEDGAGCTEIWERLSERREE